MDFIAVFMMLDNIGCDKSQLKLLKDVMNEYLLALPQVLKI